MGEGRAGEGSRRVERGGRGAEGTAAVWMTPPIASLCKNLDPLATKGDIRERARAWRDPYTCATIWSKYLGTRYLGIVLRWENASLIKLASADKPGLESSLARM